MGNFYTAKSYCNSSTLTSSIFHVYVKFSKLRFYYAKNRKRICYDPLICYMYVTFFSTSSSENIIKELNDIRVIFKAYTDNSNHPALNILSEEIAYSRNQIHSKMKSYLMKKTGYDLWDLFPISIIPFLMYCSWYPNISTRSKRAKQGQDGKTLSKDEIIKSVPDLWANLQIAFTKWL